MIKEIEDSLVKYLADHGIKVGVNADNLESENDIITLSGVTPFVWVDGDKYEKMEISYYIYLFGNKEEIHEKLDKLLAIKNASEQPFKIYDVSSGIATETDNFTISMPNRLIMNTPLGSPIMDEIFITIRRER
jgi:hypothetical protein